MASGNNGRGWKGFPSHKRYYHRFRWGPVNRWRTKIRNKYPRDTTGIYNRLVVVGDSLAVPGGWSGELDNIDALGVPGQVSANWKPGGSSWNTLANHMINTFGYDYTGVWVIFNVGTNDRGIWNVSPATYRSNVIAAIDGLEAAGNFVLFPKDQCVVWMVEPYVSETIAIAATGARTISQRTLLEVNVDPVYHYDVTSSSTTAGGPVDPPVGAHPNRRGAWLLCDALLDRIQEWSA